MDDTPMTSEPVHPNGPPVLEDDADLPILTEAELSRLVLAHTPAQDAPPEDTPETDDAPPPAPEVHPEVERLWHQLHDTGQASPSWRAMRDALKERGVRIGSTQLTVQLQRLRAGDLAAPQPTDAVTVAEARLATARQAVAAVQTEHLATEAHVAQLDATLATLIARASAGDGEAAQAIPETRETLKLTLRTVAVHLPQAKAQVEAEEAAAKRALAEACDARDLADFNRLCEGDAPLDRAVMEATDVLHERMLARLSHALAQRTLAGRLGIPFGEASRSPERRLAAYVLGRLADVAPPYPSGVGRSPMPQITDLVETSTTSRPLTADEVAAAQGTGRVHVVYRGTRLVQWDGCERRPPQTQAAFQGHLAVEFSMADYATLHARYGDELIIVPPPLWG
jgi:hypothetical protein